MKPMKLKKAIEELRELPDSVINDPSSDQQGALKLGIEALKRVQQCRSAPYGRLEDILPGETPEEE